MRFAGFSLLLAALLAGCAAGAPDTFTPPRPTQVAGGSASPTPEPGVPSQGPAAAPQPPPSALEGERPGSGDTRQGRGNKTPTAYDELVGFGEELTAALESGDVEAWMALTTLRGDAAQQQRDWFAGVQAVPMDVREMHPTWLIERDVVGEVEGPLVEFAFRHQVSGVDVLPSVELYDLTLERVGADGPYRIVSVSGSDALDSAYPQLWDLRPIEVVQTDHTVLIAEAGSGLEDIAEGLDEAAAAVFDLFPVDGVSRMSVTVVDQALVATVLGDSEEGAYAGFAVPVPASRSVETGGVLPEVVVDDSVGVRLVIDQGYTEDEWAAFDEPEGGSPLMRHEGLHLAMMLRYPDDVPPRWAVEGFAGWVEVSGDPAVRASHETWYPTVLLDGELPTGLPPANYWGFFDEDDPEAIERNYMEAANIFLYAEDAFGRETTLALGDALHGHDTWLDGDEDLDATFRDRLGVDVATFEAGYVDWLHDTYDS